MERGVDRVPPEPHRLLHVVQEGPRAERQLDDVVDLLEAGAVAELEAELEEAARGEPVAGRAAGRPRRRAGGGCPGPVRGLRGSAGSRPCSSRSRDATSRRRRRRSGRPIGDRPPVMNASRSPPGRTRGRSSRRSRRSSGRGRSTDRRRVPAGSAPRRGRCRRRAGGSCTSACSCGVEPGMSPTGVERPVPRWSMSSTR